MNWTSISESVLTAVFGALILSLVYWIVGLVRRRKALQWYELADGSTQIDGGDYETKVAYCTLMLKNRSREIIRDVEILFDHPVVIASSPSGTKIEVVSQEADHRVRIAVMQARQEIRLTVHRMKAEYISAKKVFVGDEDMGGSVHHKLVPSETISVPFWAFMLLIFIIVWVVIPQFIKTFDFPPQNTSFEETNGTSGETQ